MVSSYSTRYPKGTMNTRATNYWQLPSHLRTLIHADLKPGESIVWVGTPNPNEFVKGSEDALGIAGCGLFWTAASIFMMIALFKDGIGADKSDLLILLFVLFGILMLSAPILKWLEARKTAYVVTNYRAIIFDGGGLRTAPGDEGIDVGMAPETLYSFDLERLTDIQSTQQPDGSGDLSFKLKHSRYGDPADQSIEGGFLAIPNVKAVEKLLRQLVHAATNLQESQ